ncbi:MAG: nucleotidyl transferase AbiEii/AbiGii toxin family protein [Candidatus Sulfotelmatobacter sp.]
MIPEPQRTYVLELLQALGPIADDFVVAGAQAMKFMLRQARATKDIDFVLDAVALRGKKESVAQTLQKLGYSVVPGSQNFQFQKAIPGSKEVMRIEFMAPEELKREKDFRVDVQNGIHARACTGGTIAITESSIYELSGKLPDGSDYSASIRVTKPHALVMLKLLALDDRYRNIRGPAEARHDREEARTHAADIVAILSVQPDLKLFLRDFEKQFIADLALGVRVLKISDQYFRSNTSPGLLVYEEYLVGDKPLDRAARSEIADEFERAHRLLIGVLPATTFYQLLAGIEDCCDPERNEALVKEFLSGLENTGMSIYSRDALRFLPTSVFGGAFNRGDKFVVSTGEVLVQLTEPELMLARQHLLACAEQLKDNDELTKRYARALRLAEAEKTV